mmetsp:Transcript_26665/g.89935  ORF Transcript_26665/g.89935 Transcript_26665/m.89935 type:complete len:228 (+) Transcript_26665:198-881(+)
MRAASSAVRKPSRAAPARARSARAARASMYSTPRPRDRVSSAAAKSSLPTPLPTSTSREAAPRGKGSGQPVNSCTIPSAESSPYVASLPRDAAPSSSSPLAEKPEVRDASSDASSASSRAAPRPLTAASRHSAGVGRKASSWQRSGSDCSNSRREALVESSAVSRKADEACPRGAAPAVVRAPCITPARWRPSPPAPPTPPPPPPPLPRPPPPPGGSDGGARSGSSQ